MSFVLQNNDDLTETRTTEINGMTFEVEHIKQVNLWKIKQPGIVQSLPKEFQGFFTSINEAYKAASKYAARMSTKKDKKNGDSTARITDSSEPART